jgi:hypothetical protein
MALEQPKKPIGGAYGQFMNENRAAFAKECEGKPITEVAKLGGARFKELSAEEKAKYQKKFEDAHTKYKTDMEAFLQAGGEKAQPKRKSKDGKAKKQKKDPEAPKRPAGGAFGCYLNKMRPEFMKECQGKPITAITKLASERWKQLGEKEKEAFEQEYKVKKEAYDEAMKNYTPPAAEEGEEGEPKTKMSKGEERAKAKEEKAAAKEAKVSAKAAAKAEKSDSKPKVKASPKSKIAVKGKFGKKAAAKPEVELQAAVKAKAEQAGYLEKLQRLAAMPDVASSGKSQTAMLKALEESSGLLHPAKRALLGA